MKQIVKLACLCLSALLLLSNAGYGQSTIRATVRDFQVTHPNMLTREEFNFSVFQYETGIVLPELGPDRKPVFNTAGMPFATVTNADDFYDWFNDVEGVNLKTEIELVQRPSGSIGSYGNDFDPINGQLFDEGKSRFEDNIHFTMEANLEFTYRGGESLRVRSDDDLWIFIDEKLAIDAGGVHDVRTDQIKIEIDDLGLEVGETYPFDIFYAERAVEGYFFINTELQLRNVPETAPIACWGGVGIISYASLRQRRRR